MKKLLLLLTLISLYFLGCSDQKNTQPEITFNDSAYIKLSVINCFDTTHLSFITIPLFPYRPITKSLDITHDGIYYFSHKTIKPDFIDIEFKKKFQTYVIPGDTLKIYANLDPNIDEKEAINIDGIFGEISAYFSKKHDNFGFWNESFPLTEFSNIKYPLEKSISLTDSLFYAEIDFLNEYHKKNNLPEWFYKALKIDCEYKRIYFRHYLISARKFFFQEKIRNPEDYYIFEEMPLFNPEAIFSDSYYSCVNNYLLSLLDYDDLDGKSGIDRAFPLFERSIPDAKKILKGKVLEYYMASKISMLFELSREPKHLKMCDSLFSTIKDQFKNDDIVKILENQRDVKENYLINKLLSARILNTGDKAPEFELLGIDNKKHRLSEFEGKTIYLHFWATWCGPCISELPYVNELIAKTDKSKFIVVNICLDNENRKWKQLLHDHRLQGINLICDDNWSKKLTSQYKISAIPHYTLIDENGLIINNNCEKPAHIDKEISQLIERK